MAVPPPMNDGELDGPGIGRINHSASVSGRSVIGFSARRVCPRTSARCKQEHEVGSALPRLPRRSYRSVRWLGSRRRTPSESRKRRRVPSTLWSIRSTGFHTSLWSAGMWYCSTTAPQPMMARRGLEGRFMTIPPCYECPVCLGQSISFYSRAARCCQL